MSDSALYELRSFIYFSSEHLNYFFQIWDNSEWRFILRNIALHAKHIFNKTKTNSLQTRNLKTQLQHKYGYKFFSDGALCVDLFIHYRGVGVALIILYVKIS